jgi:hypothetical protein
MRANEIHVGLEETKRAQNAVAGLGPALAFDDELCCEVRADHVPTLPRRCVPATGPETSVSEMSSAPESVSPVL